MAQFSNCLSIISRMSERDQDSLVTRLDELQAQGVPAEKAQVQAAIDVLMRAQADAAGIRRSITREQALETNVPVEMPQDSAFDEAAANTPGARVDEEGLHMRLVRWQKPEQEAGRAIRTGVFYLPDGSKNSRHYKTSESTNDSQSYGGSVRMDGETLIRRPLFVKGATGGKAPEAAYVALRGKEAMKKLDSDVFGVVNEQSWMTRQGGRGLFVERVQNLLREYDADPGLAGDVVAHSQRGNQLRYALQENIIAHAIRSAGHDAVVGYSKGKSGAFISEVFDVREQTFPSNTMESDVHEDFLSEVTRSVSRDTYAWRDSIDTSVGPLLQGEDFYLLPQREITQDDFGDNGFAANGLMGHAERAVPGTRTIAYRIVGDNGIIGTLVSDVDPAGVLRSVHDIEITDRRSGIGSKVIATIAANTQAPIKIQDITDEADQFWTRIGVGYKDQYGDAFLDWEDVSQYLGARRAAQVDPDAAPAAGRDRGLQEGSYEVSELSPEEAADFFKFSKPRATETAAFKKWFGDSKVVDANGNPLVVYHSTDAEFYTFVRTPYAHLGHHFGTAGQAKKIGGRNLVEAYLSIKNPLRTIDAGDWSNPYRAWDVLNKKLKGALDDLMPKMIEQTDRQDRLQLLSARLQSLGYDGIVYKNRVEGVGDSWVALEPAQIKSATGNNGAFDPNDANITRSVARPAFYSQLQRAIEQVPDRLATMAAPQWKLWLDANASKLGIKKDEIEWSGVGDYLKLRGKDKVSREDLVAYLADSGVRVQEVVLGSTGLRDTGEMYVAEANDWGDEWAVFTEDGSIIGGTYESQGAAEQAMDEMNSEGKPTKYGSYTVPGGENYREVLITLPVKRELPASYKVEPNPSKASNAKKFIVVDGAGERYGSGDTQQEALDRYFANHTPNAYRSSHWEQPNIIAHLRVDDRVDADGNKVLFLQEIQSDWSSEGRKKGFDKPPMKGEVRPQEGYDPALADQWEAEDSGPAEKWAVYWEDGTFSGGYDTKEAAEQRLRDAAHSKADGVPRAPFVEDTKSYVALALKRAIMMAVEEGHDKIAIITGEQAAGLYSLDKQVDSITYEPTEKGFYINVLAGGSNIKHGNFNVDELGDIVGKEIVQKMQAREGRQEFDPKVEPDLAETRVLDGDGLKVQATGMRKFYDELVPQVARDVLKKLGGGQLGDVVFGGFKQDARYTVFDEDTGESVFSSDSNADAREFARVYPGSVEIVTNEYKRDVVTEGVNPGFDITTAMREKVASGVPLFSKGRTSAGADWESPSASKFDDLVYKFQDKQIETKRVVEAIKEASGAISDDLNVYLNEELYHGRTAKRTEDFLNMELNPLIEEMAKANMKIADLEEFLHARHAKEANAVIAQRNPGEPGLQDGGSGMTNAEADKYMATLPAADRAVLEAAAAKVDAIIAGTRKMFVDYELESKSTVDGWNSMFKHYVPLQREDKEGSPGLGQGFSIKGKETKGRTGSTRKVVDILANIAMQRERAIVRGEKNRVAKSLVGLARANENPDFWMVDEVPIERAFNPKTGLVEDRVDPMYKSRENAVVAKIKDPSGVVREHAVLFNEEDPRALRMAQALKNLDAQQLNGLLGVSAKITRYFAAVNTQYNPVFGVVNLVRDVQGAMLNLSSTPLKDDKVKIAKYTASALSGIYGDMRAARKGQNQTSAWAALWDEFQEVGGQTGYREMFATSADRAEAIQKALDPATWMDSKLGKVFTANGALKVPIAQAQKQAGFIFDWLSDYNNAMENGVRLAAYKAGLERGMTKQQAASAAKNLTTNFNRKGQAAQQAGAMYAFFNAAIQGTARIGRTLFDMEPGKPKTIRLSSAGKKIVYGGILLGAIQALALAAAGFNDDDPPEFARERSLIIPIGGKKYISIPMPLGFHVLPSIGRISTEFMLSGFKDPHKRALSLASLFAETFNPIGNAGLSMQTLAPTALDPLVALTENRDWTGRPIARESSNKAIPGHALGRDTATSVAKLLSEAINTLSGGNKYTSGVFSPTPDQIDYLIGQATGGVGRELSKVEQTALSTARGESLPTYKVPLVGRFIGDAKSQASEGTAFYANTERLNRIETEMKGLQKDGKIAEATALRMSHSEAYLITMANQAERQIQKLRAEKRELVKANAPRDRVKAIEDRITAVMARLNRAMESLQEKQEN